MDVWKKKQQKLTDFASHECEAATGLLLAFMQKCYQVLAQGCPYKSWFKQKLSFFVVVVFFFYLPIQSLAETL